MMMNTVLPEDQESIEEGNYYNMKLLKRVEWFTPLLYKPSYCIAL